MPTTTDTTYTGYVLSGWSDATNTFTNASNQTFENSITLTAVWTLAEPTVTLSGNESFYSYGETLVADYSHALKGVDGASASYKWTVGGNEVSTVNSYTLTTLGTYDISCEVTFSYNNGEIETSSATETKAYTVVQKTLTDTTADISVAYDGESHSITVSATGFVDEDDISDGTITYCATSDGTFGSTNLVFTNATDEAQTVYYQVTFENYETITGSATVAISKVALTDTTGDVSVAYDGENHSITVSATGFVNSESLSAGTITYCATSDGTFGSTNLLFTNATDGAQTVYYQVTFTNYETITGSATVAISKVDLTDTTDNVSVAYDGTSHSITVSATGFVNSESLSAGNIEYRTLQTEDWSLINPQFVNVEEYIEVYTVYYQVTFTNYEMITGSATVTISKATLTNTTADVSVVYDGTNHSITVSATGFVTGDDISNGTVEYRTSPTGNWSLTNLEFVNAGIYTVYYQVLFTNYETITGSKTVTISKVALTDTTDDLTVAYDGESHSITVSATGFVNSESLSAGTITYCATSDGTFGSTNLLFTNATDEAQTVYYKVTFVNYDDLIGVANITVTKRTITVTIANANSEKDAEIVELSYSVTSGSVVEGDQLGITLSKAAGTDTGAYAITGTYNNNNYAVTFVNGVYSIYVKDLATKIGDEELDVTIETDGEFVYNLNVVDYTTEAATQNFRDEVLSAVNITYTDNENNAVAYSDAITVTLELGSSYSNGDNVKVVRYNLDGTVTEVSSTVSNGYITFTTNDLGEYVLLRETLQIPNYIYIIAVSVGLIILCLGLIIIFVNVNKNKRNKINEIKKINELKKKNEIKKIK